MADVVFRPEFDDSELRRALQQLQQTTKTVEGEVQKIGDAQAEAFRKATGAANEYDEVLKEMTSTTAEVEQALQDAGKATEEVSKGGKSAGDVIENLARKVNVFGVNLGDAIGKLRQKKAAMEETASAAGGMTKAMRLLAAGGIAGLIAAVVAALAVFVKFGTNIDATQKKIQGIKDQIVGWKAVMKPAIETLALFTKSIGQFIGRDYSGAVASWTQATVKWKEEVIDTKNEIADLQRVIRALDIMELGARIQDAEIQGQIEAARDIAADTERSAKARLQALREYEDLQRSVYRRELGMAEVALQVAQTQNTTNKLTEEEVSAKERVFAAQAALAALERETAQQRRDILNKEAEEAKKRREAEAARLQKSLEAYGELVDKLGAQTDKAMLSRLYDPEKLVLEREFAIKEVEKFIAELVEAARDAGVELPASFQDDFKIIFNAIDEELKRGLQEMSDKGIAQTQKNIQAFSDRIAGDQLRILAEQQEKALLSIFDRTKEKLLDSLGLNEEQAQFILQSFGRVFDSLADMWAVSVNAQLEQQYRLIEASQERIASLEQDVDAERELKRQGLASNLEDAKNALAAEQAVLQAAQEKALAIERKAANQQLIVNSILQASELAVAASKVINANAGIPIAGPVIAAAGIALLFSILAQAKANAARFSQVPKLRKGARLEGATHEGGGVPLISDGKFYEAERGEWLIGTAHSKEHDNFLQRLNDGKYRNMNLLALAEQARENRVGAVITNIYRTERKLEALTKRQEIELMRQAYEQAANKSTERMIEYLQTRPIDTPFKNGIRRERVIGKKKVVEIIKNQ